jgi:hypothetical protein
LKVVDWAVLLAVEKAALTGRDLVSLSAGRKGIWKAVQKVVGSVASTVEPLDIE